MKITLTLNTAQGQRKIDALVSSLQDLQPALKIFNGYFRKKVQAKFASGGPGWPPTQAGEALAPGTAAVKALADELLRKKLERDYRRAIKKSKDTVSKKGRFTSAATKVARRYMVLREFERLAAGGIDLVSITGDSRLDKSVARLRDRHLRATEQASQKPLGKIASSIKSEIGKSELRVYSKIEWAGVHNAGGVAGHGAKIPARTFLEIGPEDVDVLAEILVTRALEAFENGGL